MYLKFDSKNLRWPYTESVSQFGVVIYVEYYFLESKHRKDSSFTEVADFIISY